MSDIVSGVNAAWQTMCVVCWIDPMLGGSGHVSDSLIAVVLGPVGAALLVALVVFIVVKLYASRRRRQQRLQHGNTTRKYLLGYIPPLNNRSMQWLKWGWAGGGVSPLLWFEPPCC